MKKILPVLLMLFVCTFLVSCGKVEYETSVDDTGAVFTHGNMSLNLGENWYLYEYGDSKEIDTNYATIMDTQSDSRIDIHANSPEEAQTVLNDLQSGDFYGSPCTYMETTDVPVDGMNATRIYSTLFTDEGAYNVYTYLIEADDATYILDYMRPYGYMYGDFAADSLPDRITFSE